MRQVLMVLTAATLLNAEGCIISRGSEYDDVVKLRSGQYLLISKQELEELQREADLGKSTGRYQVYKGPGWRTWRLDTATGDTCLLLTTEEDWKKPHTQEIGCEAQ